MPIELLSCWKHTCNNLLQLVLPAVLISMVGQNSVFRIAIRYRLGGSAFEPQWRRRVIFHTRLWGPLCLLWNWQHFLPGVKRPGRGVDHPIPYIAESNKNYSYNTTSPVARRSMLQGELYLLPFIT